MGPVDENKDTPQAPAHTAWEYHDTFQVERLTSSVSAYLSHAATQNPMASSAKHPAEPSPPSTPRHHPSLLGLEMVGLSEDPRFRGRMAAMLLFHDRRVPAAGLRGYESMDEYE
ncbi:hypothetical protein M8818_004929 [Zalaria obscura]|uniref:Uncharacterized protein n=1 Tax=Zalaria obscura TaxID=2024903 RepID=A0ACC3SAF3_9PEZI